MRFIKIPEGLFVAPHWVNRKTNKRQLSLIGIKWHIRFQNQLNQTRNEAFALRKRLIGK